MYIKLVNILLNSGRETMFITLNKTEAFCYKNGFKIINMGQQMLPQFTSQTIPLVPRQPMLSHIIINALHQPSDHHTTYRATNMVSLISYVYTSCLSFAVQIYCLTFTKNPKESKRQYSGDLDPQILTMLNYLNLRNMFSETINCMQGIICNS
jgi:hypothetical protein